MDFICPFNFYLLLLFAFYHNNIINASTCGNLSPHGEMYPNPSYILVGDDLRFNCTLNPDNDHWNSSNIFFRFHNDPIEKQYFHIVDQYTAQLILPNATEHHSGRYYCLAKSNSHSNSTFICLSEAEVGREPQFLSVEELECTYLYGVSLSCSWFEPGSFLKTSYEFFELPHGVKEYSNRCGKLNFVNRTDRENQTQTVCIWNTETPFRPMLQEVYYFKMRVSNYFGEYNFSYEFLLDDILKLEPAKSLKFFKENNTLMWSIAKVKHRVETLLRFKILIDDLDLIDAQYLNQSNEGRNEFNITNFMQRSVQLNNLKNYTNYNFTIICFTDGSQYLSEPLTITAQTKQYIPSRPPTINWNSFQTIKISKKKSEATLFWKALPPEYWYGPQISYYVEYYDGDELISIRTDYPNCTIKNLDNKKRYEFRIFSTNRWVGNSENFSTIHLPPYDKLLTNPKPISIIRKSNNQYELKWKRSVSNQIKNYTLYWCTKPKNYVHPLSLTSLPLTKIGCDEFEWIDINVGQQTYTLELEHELLSIGLAANSDQSSSGIYWEYCMADMKRNDYHLSTFTSEALNSKSIRIKWDYMCYSQQELISKELIIHYCQVDKSYNNSVDYEPICMNDEKKKEIHLNNYFRNDYLITGLSPNTYYLVELLSPNLDSIKSLWQQTHSNIPNSPKGFKFADQVNKIIEWIHSFDDSKNDDIDHYVLTFQHETVQIKPTDHCKADGMCQYSLPLSIVEEMVDRSSRLKPYTEYPITLKACNSNEKCSEPPSITMFRTKASRPGPMPIPRYDRLSTTKFRINFQMPIDPNGPIDFFYLVRGDNDPVPYNASIHNYVDIDVLCRKNQKQQQQGNSKSEQNSDYDNKIALYASNIVDGIELANNQSEWIMLDPCQHVFNSFFMMFPLIVIGITIMLIIGLYIFRHLNKLKAQKTDMKINVYCNSERFYELAEKSNQLTNGTVNEVVSTSINYGPKIIEQRKISSSSVTSNSSIVDHSNEKSSSLSSSDSTSDKANFNYRENNEYFLSNCEPHLIEDSNNIDDHHDGHHDCDDDDLRIPLMSNVPTQLPSSLSPLRTFDMSNLNRSSNMNNYVSLNSSSSDSSSSNSQPNVQNTNTSASSFDSSSSSPKGTYVPLSPIISSQSTPSTTTASPSSNSHYVSHQFMQNMRHPTNV